MANQVKCGWYPHKCDSSTVLPHEGNVGIPRLAIDYEMQITQVAE